MNITLIEREPGHLPKPVTMTSTSGRLKILTLGDSYVGKSTLIKAYCEGKFITDYIPTIGIDFGVRATTIEDVEVKINFWDVAGDPLYFEVRNEFYKDTHGVLLIYDLSSRRSFENLMQWVSEINKFMDKTDVVIHLVGNKLDKEPRIVSFEEATKFAMNNNFKYTEISSKNMEAVNKLFDELFLDVINIYRKQSNETSETDNDNEEGQTTPLEEKNDIGNTTSISEVTFQKSVILDENNNIIENPNEE